MSETQVISVLVLFYVPRQSEGLLAMWDGTLPNGALPGRGIVVVKEMTFPGHLPEGAGVARNWSMHTGILAGHGLRRQIQYTNDFPKKNRADTRQDLWSR